MMSGLSLPAWAHATPHESRTKSCHSTQPKITLLFNNVGPNSASQFSFFNYVRPQRIKRRHLSHKPTQCITIFLLESRELTQPFTITILLLPTQSVAILLFQTREPTQRIKITFLLSPTQGIMNFPLSIT